MTENNSPKPQATYLYVAYLLYATLKQRYPEMAYKMVTLKDQGFASDFDLGDGQSLSEKDFETLEKDVWQCSSRPRFVLRGRAELEEWLRQDGQLSLLKILQDSISEEFLSLSDDGFQMPGFIESNALISEARPKFYLKFKSLGGAYWQNDSSQPQLQRLEVLVFASEGELEDYVQSSRDKRLRDHRLIGKEQELFMFSDLVGKGLPLFLEDGATLKRQLENFVIDESIKAGYTNVITPDIAQLELYKVSGHYPYYQDSMYTPIELEGQKLMLRPMTCPHHFQIYKQKPRSYKDLPIRLAELAKLYRREQSGELLGLLRVLSFTLSDAHIICRPDQALEEIIAALQLIDDMASKLGLRRGMDYFYDLSLGDRQNEEKYYKDDEAWQVAEQILRQALKTRGDNFKEVADEAAFYGPKIDVQMVNNNGQQETAFTVQYDFVMPKRFQLTYLDADNQAREAVVIHRSFIGAIERLMAFLIEFHEGKFPVWLSPCQLKLLTVDDSSGVCEIAKRMTAEARAARVRVKVDTSDKTLGKKIRQSQLEAVPYIVVIGSTEIEKNRYKLRVRSDISADEQAEYTFSEILELINKDIAAFR